MFFDLLQLVKRCYTVNVIKKNKWSSSEQASNETVANNSWRCHFANPDRYTLICNLPKCHFIPP